MADIKSQGFCSWHVRCVSCATLACDLLILPPSPVACSKSKGAILTRQHLACKPWLRFNLQCAFSSDVQNSLWDDDRISADLWVHPACMYIAQKEAHIQWKETTFHFASSFLARQGGKQTTFPMVVMSTSRNDMMPVQPTRSTSPPRTWGWAWKLLQSLDWCRDLCEHPRRSSRCSPNIVDLLGVIRDLLWVSTNLLESVFYFGCVTLVGK